MTTKLKPGELEALLDEILGPRPLPKPKLVITETRNAERKPEVVRDVKGEVYNVRRNRIETVEVRRPDPAWLPPMGQVEAQWWERQAAAERRRQLIAQADPFGLGHWGQIDE